ncbi:chymotrypsin-2-like isoform X6 [Diachasmimorpha longicaudata]|uniref:chymotrypsin-2-like isoform X6 n=1 Tax=Diachasmimorpha longicaudata TaxID=58733 RepID=UPI0030B8CAD5
MYFSLWIWICLILFENSQCGDAIHFGKIPEEGQFKYMAAIFYNSCYQCGGTIIDDRHILTAAHCVFDREVQGLVVLVGTVDLQSTRPRRWQDFLPKNDIAVLTLTDSIVLGDKATPVMLPSDDALPYCAAIPFAGWGTMENDPVDSLARFMNFNIISAEVFKEYDLASSENQFDAADFTGRSKVDKGDSGGPLVHNNIVYGILSTGWSSHLGNSAIFTQVYGHLDFIKNATRA